MKAGLPKGGRPNARPRAGDAMVSDTRSELAQAIAQIPCGMFILTARFEESASGVLVSWVQRCSIAPPMVMVAIRKGQTVEPLIRDSRAFALCQISADDRYLQRKFAALEAITEGPVEDPFVTLATRCAVTGSPIIERAMSYLDCELVRNIELDCDHRLYVGLVHCGGVLRSTPPAVYYGGSEADVCRDA
jgi:flavin reductase (DIM6/NTAB) family NADH-FMN oxidoreductase RutF